MAFDTDLINAPHEFRSSSLLLRPLRVSDAELDYEAVMESRHFLRDWEQTNWPANDFTLEENRKDLERHEREHETGEAFTYTVMDLEGTVCLGCVYIFAADAPVFLRSEIVPAGDADWQDVSAAVYFWIRKSGLSEALDRQLLDALLPWLRADWGFGTPVIVTSAPFTQQVAMIEAASLPLRFRVRDPKAVEEFLAFGTH